MTWVVETTAADGTDPVASFYCRQLAGRIREYWERLESVVVSWRRGPNWIPAPVAIHMPKEKNLRKQATPEEGARKLFDLAYSFAVENQAMHLKFIGLGLSTTEESAKELFSMSLQPLAGKQDEEKSIAEKTTNAAVEAARVLTDAVGVLGNQLNEHGKRELGLLDKASELIGKNTATTETILVGLAFQQQMKREEQQHEVNMEELKNNQSSFDGVLNIVGKPMSDALQRLLDKAFGLGEAFNGETFGKRLGAIVHAVAKLPDGESRLQKAHDIVGEEAWGVLKAMSNAPTDDEFREIGRKFIELLGPDPNPKFHAIAAALGQGPSMALLQLISDSGIAK
jgi:hypothetical protein